MKKTNLQLAGETSAVTEVACLTFVRNLLFLNFIDHADTSYWLIFFIIVMYLVMIALS